MSTFPSSIGISSIALTSQAPTISTESKSYRRHVGRIPAHRFEVRLKTIPLNQSQHRELWGFITALEGSFNPFSMVLPLYSEPRGVATGSPNVKANTNAGAKTVLIQGYTPSINGIAKTGDVVRFAGHTKVYQVREDANSDAQGEVILKLSSNLIESVKANEVLTVRHVPFTLSLKNDAQEFKASAQTDFVTMELDLQESF
ncbi:hypothetical protein [Pleionea sp. CnH1-48]|uniref:hypothetical protein n=1 Tax=Pleionea sp. CnH1-48 TaxID=2954494 RepID=UPI002096E3C8|nr:hypothetical protein [Pleionea sp. CnH1-48]MCO7225778.1 hypothetical protein [Pleionea sp. CnH1-48]